MAVPAKPIDDFHVSTAPADYPEALVKIYVGDGIAADFYREVAQFLEPDAKALVGRGVRTRDLSAFVDPDRASHDRGGQDPGQPLVAMG